jgi:peptide/nickel transport system substrate-binding protein
MTMDADRCRRRWVLAATTSIALFSLLASCDSGRDRRSAGKNEDGGRLVVGLLSDPKTLSPLAATSIESRNIIDLIFLKLLKEKGDFATFGPELAESWEFSPDSLSITFFLKKDALWADGAPVTAADVRFTWELQTDTVVAWPSRGVKDRIRRVDVIDDHTVSFRFSNRYLYQLMDANDGVVLPKHALESVPREEIRASRFWRRPVGSGPFRLARWDSDQFIELERNPLYHEYNERGLPRLASVVFRIVPDMMTLVTQLESGEIDCLESLPVDVVSDIERNHPDIEIFTYMSRHQVFIAWNLKRPLFASPDVRRALAMAVDTDEMIRSLWGGKARPNDSPMHPILWAHDPSMTPLPFDPAAARELLASSGWIDTDGDGVLEKNGRPFEFEIITNQGNQQRSDIVTMAQEYLRRVGVRVNARTLEWNTFVQKITEGDFDGCVLGWKTGTRADLTDLWRSTSTPPGGFNVARYNNATVDSLIDAAKNSLGTDEARTLWYRCQRLIYSDQPVLFLTVPYEVVGLRRGYCNVEPNAIGFFVNLPEWYAGEKCP